MQEKYSILLRLPVSTIFSIIYPKNGQNAYQIFNLGLFKIYFFVHIEITIT